jgi:uncharacterized lipoprotein YbaY
MKLVTLVASLVLAACAHKPSPPPAPSSKSTATEPTQAECKENSDRCGINGPVVDEAPAATPAKP